MLRWLYIRLLAAHPAEFRRRFADEMLESFYHSRQFAERLALLLDGMVSLFRQWVLRREFQQPWRAASSAPAYELITFQQIEPYQPRGIALAQGGLLAILLLIGIVNAINRGGNKLPGYSIGMHRATGGGLIHVSRVEGEPLSTTIEGRQDKEDPWRPFARSYFHILLVLSALDGDHNLVISAREMADAPAVLSLLDSNGDGKLSAEECGFLPPGGFNGKPAALDRYRLGFMHGNTVLAALDTNQDGEISAAEMVNAPGSLYSLDTNGDGVLTPYELIPPVALSRAAALMTRFDTFDNGVIALRGLTSEDADAASIRQILAAADRNHDGLVTRGELIVQLASGGAAHPVSVPETYR